MPAVVAEGVKECLIDCAVDKLGGGRVMVEHVCKRVGLGFEPTFGFFTNVVMASEGDGGRFARVVDDCP